MMYDIECYEKELVILKKIRKLLANPKRWCKGSFAKNEKGSTVIPYSVFASQWCLIGAIRKICAEENYVNQSKIERMINSNIKSKCNILADYNDNRSHRSVIRLLDKTITRYEKYNFL